MDIENTVITVDMVDMDMEDMEDTVVMAGMDMGGTVDTVGMVTEATDMVTQVMVNH